MLTDLLNELNSYLRLHEYLMWFSLVIDPIRDSEWPLKLYLCQHDHNQGPNSIIQTEYAKFPSQVAAIVGLNEETVRWSQAEREDAGD